jgi:hypothetical protein
LKNKPDFVAGRRIWRLKMVWRISAASSTVHGDGSMDPWLGDFPCAEKPAPSSKACGGAAATARHRPVMVVVLVGIQKGLICIFFLFSGSFCKNGFSI